jgi:predicted nucleic acid-binding protein
MEMSRIFWDTNLFVYLFEDYGSHSKQVKALLQKMDERGDELFTSALTIGEVLAGPMEQGDLDCCDRYENAIRSNGIIVPFDVPAARNFAKLRAQPGRNIRPPDAIQLACAATAKVDLFLTNDKRLHNLHVDGIHFITSVDRAPI